MSHNVVRIVDLHLCDQNPAFSLMDHIFLAMYVTCGFFLGLNPFVEFLFLLGSNNHRSHQDYMEKADKARKARLSSSPSPSSDK